MYFIWLTLSRVKIINSMNLISRSNTCAHVLSAATVVLCGGCKKPFLINLDFCQL